MRKRRWMRHDTAFCPLNNCLGWTLVYKTLGLNIHKSFVATLLRVPEVALIKFDHSFLLPPWAFLSLIPLRTNLCFLIPLFWTCQSPVCPQHCPAKLNKINTPAPIDPPPPLSRYSSPFNSAINFLNCDSARGDGLDGAQWRSELNIKEYWSKRYFLNSGEYLSSYGD